MKLSKKLIAQLDQMVGTTRLYMGTTFKITGYSIMDEDVRIGTDKRTVVIKKSKLYDSLPEFMEVETSVATASKSNVMMMQHTSEINQLKSIAMDTIKKIQEDKGYINQARAINDSIGTVLKMNQQMIDMYREVRKSGGTYE
jgi:hypothetical protein